ncbi:MAG: hypothetical protein IH851_08380 [Armatimonadetes bacterium]|nr:hypothetical protein [Armatimonadota bacterium]
MRAATKTLAFAGASVFSLLAIGVLNGCGGPDGGSVGANDATASAERAAHDRHLRPDEPLAAAAYRDFQRLSADGAIPDNALWIAKQQRDLLIDGQGDGGGISAASWTWLGPGNIGGRIRAIVFHPSQPQIIWIGSASGGIWKTVYGGAFWFPLDDFMATLSVAHMVMDPTNPDVIYAGTGEGFFNNLEGSSNTAAVRGAGVFKTTDGGETWDQIPSTSGAEWYAVNRLAISPSNNQVMLAATADGIFRSTDAGDTWSQMTTDRTLDVKFHPTNGSLAVAGHADGTALYSTNGGVNWFAAIGLTGTRVELAYARSNPNIVYAAVSSSGRIKIYRSTNGGQNYFLRTSGSGIRTYSLYNSVIWVDPTRPDVLILGGVWLYRSIDGGVTLSRNFGAVHADMHAIVEHPSYNGAGNRIVFFGNDGGIHRTDDVYATSAVSLNNNLGITQFYGAAVNPTSGVVVGGTQDNFTLRFGGDPQAWTILHGGDGGFSASDPTDPNYFYGEAQRAHIFRSSDGGLTSSDIFSGLGDAQSSRINFIPYLMLDPNEPNRMLVAALRLWRTDDVKTGTPPTWQIIKESIQPFVPGGKPDPPVSHFNDNSPWHIATIEVAEGDSDLIYVGYNNGEVWKSIDGTSETPSWTRLDDNTPGLPGRWVSRIVVDPNNHDRVYVSFMGWEPDNVWRTTNGGTTWEQITGTVGAELPSAPASALNIHRTVPGRIYVGTDIGIFTSNDDGLTWTANTEGPGTVPVEELIWKNDNRLMAVTHGRGIFLATVSPTEEPVSPDSYFVERGLKLSGSLDDLIWSDDNRMNVRPWFVLTTIEAPVRVRVQGVSPITSPAELRFRLEASVSIPNISQRIELFDYSGGQFETVDVRAATTSDVPTVVVITSDPARFIDPATGEVKARVSFKESGPILSYPWVAKIDQILWTIAP